MNFQKLYDKSIDKCSLVYNSEKKNMEDNDFVTCLRVMPGKFLGNGYARKQVRLSSPSLESFVHEFGHGLGLVHAASFSRDTLRGATPWASWFDYKEYGNALSAMGGKGTMEHHNFPDNGGPVRGVYFSGASGYMPNEMAELRWWPKEQFAFVKPSETIYTLRRIGTNPDDFKHPACLVWKDARTHGYHWFTYHLNADVFQDDVSDDSTGFSHVITYGFDMRKPHLAFKPSIMVKLFKGSYDSPSGLRFDVLESNDNTVKVKVSFKEELLKIPMLHIYTKNDRIHVLPAEPTAEHSYLPFFFEAR